MTNETIDLIIEFFGHIKQIATDRKTLTGVVMDRQQCLDEIAAKASRCERFVEKYRNEQESINEEELEKLTKNYLARQCDYHEGLTMHEQSLIRNAFKAGYIKRMEV